MDYRGLEDWVATGWHRKLHIFQVPFYYVEYGLAQLGALGGGRRPQRVLPSGLAVVERAASGPGMSGITAH